jgi:hypothetical protein
LLLLASTIESIRWVLGSIRGGFECGGDLGGAAFLHVDDLQPFFVPGEYDSNLVVAGTELEGCWRISHGDAVGIDNGGNFESGREINCGSRRGQRWIF